MSRRGDHPKILPVTGQQPWNCHPSRKRPHGQENTEEPRNCVRGDFRHQQPLYSQQNQKHQPGNGNIDEYQSELGELYDGRQPRYFQQNQKPERGHGNMVHYMDEHQSELGKQHDGQQPRYFQQNQKHQRGHGSVSAKTERGQQPPNHVSDDFENTSELGEQHDGQQPRYFQQNQKPERGHGSVSAKTERGQQPPDHFSDDLENEKPRHVQDPRKHVCQNDKRTGGTAVRVYHQTRENNPQVQHNAFENYQIASPEDKTALLSAEPLSTKIKVSPNIMYPHTDQRYSIKSSKDKLKKYILDPTETMLLPDYFKQNIFVVDEGHDLTGCLECTWGSTGRRLTGAHLAERIRKCRHQGKLLAVISGWTRISILNDSMETIIGIVRQSRDSKWLSVFEESDAKLITKESVLLPCRLVNALLPVVPIIQMCNRNRDVHSLPPTEVEKVIKMREVLEVSAGNTASTRRLLTSNIRAHHQEKQRERGLNQDVRVDCAFEGTAFRSYLLDAFDIHLKHGEDGRHLVKNYQSMVQLGLMTWWISACTEIVETEQALCLSHSALDTCLTALERHRSEDSFLSESTHCAVLAVFISQHPLTEIPRCNRHQIAKIKNSENFDFGQSHDIPYDMKSLAVWDIWEATVDCVTREVDKWVPSISIMTADNEYEITATTGDLIQFLKEVQVKRRINCVRPSQIWIRPSPMKRGTCFNTLLSLAQSPMVYVSGTRATTKYLKNKNWVSMTQVLISYIVSCVLQGFVQAAPNMSKYEEGIADTVQSLFSDSVSAWMIVNGSTEKFNIADLYFSESTREKEDVLAVESLESELQIAKSLYVDFSRADAPLEKWKRKRTIVTKKVKRKASYTRNPRKKKT